jgi:hypothetical protein
MMSNSYIQTIDDGPICPRTQEPPDTVPPRHADPQQVVMDLYRHSTQLRLWDMEIVTYYWQCPDCGFVLSVTSAR